MAWSPERVHAHIKQVIRPKIHSKFFLTKPLAYFLAGQRVTDLNGVGSEANTGAFFGGTRMSQSNIQEYAGSVEFIFRFQKSQPDPAEGVAVRGNTPAATVYGEELTEQARIRWTDVWAPWQVGKDVLDSAKGDNAIGNLIEETIEFSTERVLDFHQQGFWTGTLTEAEQDTQTWTKFLGVQHTVDGSGGDFYGGRSRDTYTMLRGEEFTSAQLATAGAIATGTTVPQLKMIQHMQIDTTVGGIATRAPGASAGDLLITTPSLYMKLHDEAVGQRQINEDASGAPPGHMLAISSQFPYIRVGNTIIASDNDCPSGEAYLLTTGFWAYEIASGNNFVTDPLVKEEQVNQGGEKKVWTNIHAKSRLICTRPDLQVKVTGLTTS